MRYNYDAMKSIYTIPLAIVLGGIIVAGAIYWSVPRSYLSGIGSSALVRPVSAADHILGNPAAKVMVVEYADFDCDYCKGFSDTMHQVIADAGAHGDVAWVYRQFPLIELHPNAMKHAEASECAAQVGGNDAFWKFTDTLFASQPVNPAQYGAFAKKIGIPTNAFATCFSGASATLDTRIMADRQNALDVGAQGTPYTLILVTGKPPIVISGAYPYDAVRQMVDEALQSVK